jgi:ParB family chromosome partitioning protein
MEAKMDNSKRNIHNSGPLGMLVKSGQIKKIDELGQNHETASPSESNILQKTSASYFKTQAGIEFIEHELIYVDPKECEPWKYANRHESEFGDIDELIESIKTNKQLQPALIRKHPAPHGTVKYEIIFGRRRHLACLKLGIPFLAIYKDIPNVQDAIASQDAENKLRNDVSNFSNAKLFQRLLQDGVFKTEKELSQKLRLSPSTLNDLMAYAKIPDDIVQKIPSVHALSKNIALKITQLINKSKENHHKILSFAHEFGKSINSPAKLESLIEKSAGSNKKSNATKLYKSATGKKLFTFMIDHRGAPCLVINKDISNSIDMEVMCDHLYQHLETTINPEHRING